jgi:hypothetical protein
VIFTDPAAYVAAVPFAPGQSPFKIKGHMYREVVAYFARLHPGGLPALFADGDPRYFAFFNQSFLPSVWYDAFPAPYIGYVAAQKLGRTYQEITLAAAADQTARNINGVYKVILRLLVSPLAVAQRMPAMTEQTFDFAPVELTKNGPRDVTLMRPKFPAPLYEWYDIVARYFLETALGMAGAKQVRVEVFAPEDDGVAHGVKLIRIGSRTTWAD